MKKIILITIILLIFSVYYIESNNNIENNNRFIQSALSRIENGNLNIDYDKARQLLLQEINETNIEISFQRRKYLENLSEIISHNDEFNINDLELVITACPMTPFFFTQPKEKIVPLLFTLIEKPNKIIKKRETYEISTKGSALTYLFNILYNEISLKPMPIYIKYMKDEIYKFNNEEKDKLKIILLKEIKNPNPDIRRISLWGLRFYTDDPVVIENIINIAENDPYQRDEKKYNILSGTYKLREQARSLLNRTNIKFSSSYNLDKYKDIWSKNTFIGMNNAVVVKKGIDLNKGEKLIIFSRNLKAKLFPIEDKFRIDYAQKLFDTEGFNNIYYNKKLWNEIGCYWVLRGAKFDSDEIAKLPEKSLDIGMGIRNLPKKELVICSSNQKLDKQEIKEYLKLINPYNTTNILIDCKKYEGNNSHEIIELSLGTPKYNKMFEMQSIVIKKFIFYNDKILEQYEFSRDRNKQEHIDVEPPRLTKKDWMDTPIKTLGFISLNNGKTWNILCINLGFEGFRYVIKELGVNKIIKYDYYLYLHH